MKMENRINVKFAVFHSNPWRQVIVLLKNCCKDTNIHENVENKISDFWLHKAENVRACHNYIERTKSIPVIMRVICHKQK